jgi:hypothetical protein
MKIGPGALIFRPSSISGRPDLFLGKTISVAGGIPIVGWLSAWNEERWKVALGDVESVMKFDLG